MKGFVVRGANNEVYAVLRHQLVDAYVSAGKVTVSSIKGTRTILVSEEEAQRVSDVLAHLFDEDDL